MKGRPLLMILVVFYLTGCYLSDHQIKTENGKNRKVTLECNQFTKANNDELKDLYLIEDCIEENGKIAKFLFGVIEFDDFGQLRSQKQFDDVLEAVKEKVEEKRVVFSLFIHGWKHNASEGSSNLHDFRKFVVNSGINGPCQGMYQNDSIDECDSVGIYIAWRGDPTGITEYTKNETIFEKPKSLIKSISIANRKAAAKRVSSIRSTQVILDLIRVVNNSDEYRISKKLNNILAENYNLSRKKFNFDGTPCYAYDHLLTKRYNNRDLCLIY